MKIGSSKKLYRNAFLVIIFIVCADLIALLVSKTVSVFLETPDFTVVNISLEAINTLVIYILLILLSVILVGQIPSLKKVGLTTEQFYTILIVSIFINFLRIYMAPTDFRNTTGGLSGAFGVVYMLSEGMTFFSFLLIISSSFFVNGSSLLRQKIIFLLILSYAINADGLANLLTLTCFICAVLRPRFGLSLQNMLLLVFALALGSYGWYLKMASFDMPVDSVVSWIAHRIAMPMESMLIYLADGSVLSDSVSVFALIVDSFFARIDFITNGVTTPNGFKSVSEAIYFDLYGEVGAGSSPGFIYGTFLVAGYFGFLYFAFFYYTLGSYLAPLSGRINFIAVMSLAFILKPVYADIPGGLSILSLSAISMFLFVVASLVSSPHSRYRS